MTILDRVRALVGRYVPPPPPCGSISPKMGATVTDLRRMGFLDAAPPGARGRKKPPLPRPWRRVCACALGHRGEWHRSEDGQVWHDTQSVTAQQAAEQDDAERRRASDVSDLFTLVEFRERATEADR